MRTPQYIRNGGERKKYATVAGGIKFAFRQMRPALKMPEKYRVGKILTRHNCRPIAQAL